MSWKMILMFEVLTLGRFSLLKEELNGAVKLIPCLVELLAAAKAHFDGYIFVNSIGCLCGELGQVVVLAEEVVALPEFKLTAPLRALLAE